MLDHGSPDTVEVGHDPGGRTRGRLVAVVVLALLAGGYVVVRYRTGDHGAAAAAPASSPVARPTPGRAVPEQPPPVVPWRDLGPGHAAFGGARGRGTPFDQVTVSGSIPGTVHAGGRLAFDAVLEAPGLVSLRPCPDYTITVGSVATTRQLNCRQVPYFASLVRPGGGVSSFRPVLPAGTAVHFRMQVTVPDRPGRQQVSWTLAGPRSRPGFSGLVEVTTR